MKKLYTLIATVILSASLWAQAPQKFSYQAVIRNASSALVVNQKVGVKISILQGSTTSIPVYTEQHAVATNENGLVSIEIGGGTVGTGEFSKIDWSKGPFYVRTETDPTGGTNYTISGESQLLSVPYALFAANSVTGGKGPKGDTGAVGPQGPAGLPGKDGVNGLDGKNGAVGPIGPKGDTGAVGAQGIKGDKGDKGETGLQGPTGKDGKVEFQNLRVSTTGDTLYLTNGNYVVIPGLSAANAGNTGANTPPTSGYGPNITDMDGNSYKTVYIGKQQWMGENLKTSKYSDGTPIPHGIDSSTWVALKSSAWVNYNNDPKYDAIYGKLYNGFVIRNDKNVCPSGWHVPKAGDWYYLMNELGGDSIAGNKLRSTDTTTLWLNPSEAAKMGIEYNYATNSSLFTALPGGVVYNRWGFNGMRSDGYWWGESTNDSTKANFMIMSYRFNKVDVYVNEYGKSKKNGFSIRCVKDGTTSTNQPTQGSIQTIDCGGATNNGILTANTAASSISSILAYTGGNGGSYTSQTIASTGVTGLTATLSAGTFANGNGSVTYNITGTPSSSGKATFAITIGGKTCSIVREIVTGENPTNNYGPNITDMDGNVYKSIKIGAQTWMAENLKTSKYSDGTPIPNVKEDTKWSQLKTGAWCNYNNNDSLGKIYGKLYNWYAISPSTNGNKNVCPTGWHVPTDSEWINSLTNYLGGESVAGGKLKKEGFTYWDSPNSDATNSSLFSGIGSGIRENVGKYHSLKLYSSFWSSSDYNEYNSGSFHLRNNNSSTSLDDFGKDYGFSIRCLKD